MLCLQLSVWLLGFRGSASPPQTLWFKAVLELLGIYKFFDWVFPNSCSP